MTDRRKKVTQLTCDESTMKQSRSVGVLLPLVYKKTQNFTIIDHQYSISIVEVQMSLLQHIP